MRPRATPDPADPNRASRARLVGAISRLAATLLLAVMPDVLPAQARATVDLGASLVRYDGFEPSTAVTITPTFDWYGQRAALNARGTYLRFESGNRSMQGSVVGSLFTRPGKNWRLEASGTGGASSYADFASFWHLLGEFRARHDTERGALWLAATAGRTLFGSSTESRPVFAGSISAMQRRGALLLLLTAGRAFVGDTQYSDIGMTARRQYRKVSLEVLAAARFWSEGAGRGLYGEASAVLPVGDRWSAVVSGGRYPSDPIRGSIAGRYVSASLRFHMQRPMRSSAPIPLPHTGSNGTDDPPPSSRLTLSRQSADSVKLMLQTPPAALVEIAGDFTDWQPVALRQSTDGSWTVVLPIAAGVHQMNLRIDGGPWIAPDGTTRLAGDFGDEVGTFVVP